MRHQGEVRERSVEGQRIVSAGTEGSGVFKDKERSWRGT